MISKRQSKKPANFIAAPSNRLQDKIDLAKKIQRNTTWNKEIDDIPCCICGKEAMSPWSYFYLCSGPIGKSCQSGQPCQTGICGECIGVPLAPEEHWYCQQCQQFQHWYCKQRQSNTVSLNPPIAHPPKFVAMASKQASKQASITNASITPVRHRIYHKPIWSKNFKKESWLSIPIQKEQEPSSIPTGYEYATIHRPKQWVVTTPKP